MFKEFSDAELVIMWHRLNQPNSKFYSHYVNTPTYKEALIELEKTHKRALWVKADSECTRRKINPFSLTIRKVVEVITYENKEVPIE